MIPQSKTAVQSKTMWINTLAAPLSFLLTAVGIDIPAEGQVAILGIVNGIVRLVTSDGIDGWF
jgi:hypothetical protein